MTADESSGLDTILDDDDQIVVISTTKRKLEIYHGSILDDAQAFSTSQDGVIDNVLGDGLMVRIKPARPLKDRRIYNYWKYRPLLLKITSLIAFVITYCWKAYWRKTKLKQNRCKSQNNDSIGTAHSTTTTIVTREVAETQEQVVTIQKHKVVVETESRSNLFVTTESTKSVQATSTLRDENHEMCGIEQEQPLTCQPNKGKHVVSCPSSAPSPEAKVNMVQTLAQDIQFFQEILTEQSLDPSLATQLAMNLRSSQHIVDSHRDFQYLQAMLNRHERHLDRQFSERQHQESLHAIKYDPNWREKLQQQKDDCWNLSNGLFRLWWEVFLLQQVVTAVIPVIRKYSAFKVHSYESPLEGRIDTSSILRDFAVSVLTHACDCPTGSSPKASNTLPSTWSSMVVNYIVNTYSDVTLNTPILLTDRVWQNWEFCSCSLHCAFSYIILVVGTTTIHYVLRLLSVPYIFHHLMNLVALFSFWGPYRLTKFIVTTISRFTAMPQGESSKEPTDWMQFSLMMSILVLLPLVNWANTETLYTNAVAAISGSTPASFEGAFEANRAQLRRWKVKQRALRYLVLFVYVGILLGKNSGHEVVFRP